MITPINGRTHQVWEKVKPLNQVFDSKLTVSSSDVFIHSLNKQFTLEKFNEQFEVLKVYGTTGLYMANRK